MKANAWTRHGYLGKFTVQPACGQLRNLPPHRDGEQAEPQKHLEVVLGSWRSGVADAMPSPSDTELRVVVLERRVFAWGRHPLPSVLSWYYVEPEAPKAVQDEALWRELVAAVDAGKVSHSEVLDKLSGG